jgi:NhaP-type Na+/H+ or K+/H+ antiporter
MDFIFKLNLKESWAFGSLISATDPVSVISLFQQVGANGDIYSMIFGESILNDAVAMVMYNTVVGIKSDSLGSSLTEALLMFIVIMIGSFLIGSILAIILSFVMKREYSLFVNNF